MVGAFSVLFIIGIFAFTQRLKRPNTKSLRDRTLDKRFQALSPNDPSLVVVTQELKAGNVVGATKAYRDSHNCDLYEARYATMLLKAKLDGIRPKA